MTLDLLEWYMKVKGFSYVRLDGSTNVRRAEGGETLVTDEYSSPDCNP